MVARWAHNPKAAGSNPAPATREQQMDKQRSLSQWLQQKCRLEHLSLRQAGAKTGLSHTTINDIIKGVQPSAKTIQKLARAFGGNGRLPLEDHLLALAGYRSEREPAKQSYLNKIPLLSGEHQHIIEILATELTKLERV